MILLKSKNKPLASLVNVNKVTLTQGWSEHIAKLRALVYRGTSDQWQDRFDETAYHLQIKLNDKLIAAIRLTPSEQGLYQTWSGGPAHHLPISNTIEVSRLVVHPNYQSKAIGALLVPLGALLGYRQDFENMVIAVKSESPESRFSKRFAFTSIAEQLMFHDAPNTSMVDLSYFDVTEHDPMHEMIRYCLKLSQRYFNCEHIMHYIEEGEVSMAC